MDFELIERHPWMTGGIVLGGGFLLYLLLRHRQASSATGQAAVAVAGGVDPQTAALQAQAAAQQTQMQGYISGLQIQGGTQVSLAQIGADVSKYTTGASADVANQQTAAQLALGVNTNAAIVAQSQINADVQMKSIDAIVAAFRGNQNPSVSPGPVTYSTPGNPNPTGQTLPQSPVNVSTPTYISSNPALGATNPGSLPPGSVVATPGGPIVPGGQLLVPLPNYIPVGAWPDAQIVAKNQQTQVDWENATLQANAVNNKNQCIANANLSKGYANYDSLMAACG
jgi:hypothetical protein